MADGMSESDLREAILAYADGELDADASRALVERMADDPQLVRQVLHQQQLRQSVARSMSGGAEAPDALRTKLNAMAAGAAQADSQSAASHSDHAQRPAVLARIGKWMPAAVAAVLLISAFAIYQSATTPTGPGPIASHPVEDSSVPSWQLAAFEQRHVLCSNTLDMLHRDDALPQRITELPQALTQRYGHATPGLDLSAIGYEFQRVGPCTVPGSNSLHLIYHAKADTGRDDSISLWIIPYDTSGRELADGQMIAVLGSEAPHPLFMWRQGEMLYYLCGDRAKGMQQAADMLRNKA